MDREIEEIDWRAYHVGKLPKNFFPGEDKNDIREEIVAVAGFSYVGKGLEPISIGFIIPSVVALMLSISFKSWVEGNLLLVKHEPYKFSGKSTALFVPIGKEKKFFDSIEKMIQSYIFAYSAIEHFANMSIPEDYKFAKREGDLSQNFMKKNDIEKYCSLEEKLKDILPKIYKKESPVSNELWKYFIKLKYIRDSLIHFKSKDFTSKMWPKEDTIWNELVFAIKKDNPAVVGKRIIGYYLNSSEEIPRWFKKCPF